MVVEDAIATAKSYVQKVFAEEEISQLRLEEVEFDEGDNSWAITISIMRPTDATDRWAAIATEKAKVLQRVYRTVKMDDSGKRLPSVKIRPIRED